MTYARVLPDPLVRSKRNLARKAVDAARIARLRAQGLGWKNIAAQLGVGVGTVLRAAQGAS